MLVRELTDSLQDFSLIRLHFRRRSISFRLLDLYWIMPMERTRRGVPLQIMANVEGDLPA